MFSARAVACMCIYGACVQRDRWVSEVHL